MNVILLWGRQRSGTNWLLRLMLKNFNDLAVVIAWKHWVPRSMPGPLHRMLVEGHPPDAEALIEYLHAPSGSPPQVHVSDDTGLPDPDALSVHPDIEKAVADAITRGTCRHVASVKHPENWLASINGEWPGQGWCLEHWNATAEWLLTLRDKHGGIILRWEDLCRDLNNLAPIERFAERRDPALWLSETRIVGNHGTEPPPDRAPFRPRKPALAPPEERALVSPAVMKELGYEWGDPLIQA